MKVHDCSNLTLFTDPPFEADDRQVIFRQVAQDIVDENEKVVIADTVRGWPASQVNMGWIQQKVCDWWERHPDATAEDLIDKIDAELCCVIQRIKRVTVRPLNNIGQKVRINSPNFRRVAIELTTKDDHGYYDYKFWVHLPERRMTVVG